MKNISVIILTYNEASDVVGCIKSVQWSDDIIVVDSYSSDLTADLARLHGANVIFNKFSGFSSQRNFALDLKIKNEWILFLDADERISVDGAREMLEFIGGAGKNVSAARMSRRDIWWGVWLKYSQISPYFVRLIRSGCARYEREINEVLVVDGLIVDLQCPFDHFPFSKGIDHWIAKHNSYSHMEAKLICEKNYGEINIFGAFFSKDFNFRRRCQKAIFYRMPFRPIIKFIYMIFIRFAFLDGVAGLRYAVLQSVYEYFIVLKCKEILLNRENVDHSE
jgi:glycosyltransferase involved in cell wall biosynthesis